jgi:hypothetical protein
MHPLILCGTGDQQELHSPWRGGDHHPCTVHLHPGAFCVGTAEATPALPLTPVMGSGQHSRVGTVESFPAVQECTATAKPPSSTPREWMQSVPPSRGSYGRRGVEVSSMRRRRHQ